MLNDVLAGENMGHLKRSHVFLFSTANELKAGLSFLLALIYNSLQHDLI